jgi:MFS family permease
MVAIVQSETWGVDSRVVGLFLSGMVLVPVLIHRSRRHPEPLIELTLFRYRSFSATNLGVAFYSLSFTSGYLASSLLLQELWNQSITTTGQALVIGPLISAAAAPLSGRLADRIGHRWILCAGAALSAVGYGLNYLLLDGEPHVFDLFVPISVLIGIGTGTTIATWASAGLSDIEPDQFGTANATVRTTQQVFYALGVAVMVTLLASGGGPGELEGYRRAWLWVAGAYAASSLSIALVFPAGSSGDRLAVSLLASGGGDPQPGAGGAGGAGGAAVSRWWRRPSRASR